MPAFTKFNDVLMESDQLGSSLVSLDPGQLSFL